MRNFKKKLFVIGLMLGAVNVNGMVGYVPESERVKNFSMSRQLSEWPKLKELTTEREKECYKMLWDYRKTLKENQKELVKKFIKTCCDFSFKLVSVAEQEILPSTSENKVRFEKADIREGKNENDQVNDRVRFCKFNIREEGNESDNEDYISSDPFDDFYEEIIDIGGMYTGKDESGDIAFLDLGDYKCKISHPNEMILDNRKGRILKVHPNMRVLSGINPMDMNPSIEKRIKKYIRKLAQDSVGCELLRTVLTKHITRGLGKITFIPITNDGWGVSYATSRYLWQAVGLSKPFEERCENNRYILFSVLSFVQGWEEPLIERIVTKDNKEQYKVVLGEVPLDAILYYSLSYSWLDNQANRAANSRRVIEKRSEQIAKRIRKNFKGTEEEKRGNFYQSNERLNNALFMNDLEFRTVFGITSKGICPLNESAYLAHRYKCMRCSHIGSNTEFLISNERVSQKEMYKLLTDFFNLGYGDNELYAYYLSTESSINYPEFGKGNYCCSDIMNGKTKE